MIRYALAIGVAVVTMNTGAVAQEDSRWVRPVLGHKEVCDLFGCRWVKVYGAPRYTPRVYSWYGAREITLQHNRNDGRRCEQVVEVLSTEHQEEANARNSAIKLWMASVQWRYGGALMDLENAVDIQWRCSASNAHDTISGRLAEGVGKLVGKEGQNVRCQLWARPCSGAREPDRGEKRR